MVTHMKTTVEIAPGLLEDAKRKAREEHRTLRDLIEEGLRRVLSEKAEKPYKLKIKPFKGKGLAPGIRQGDWEQIRELIYPPTVPLDRG